jgi:sRNA-binding regulator protein Hfq
MVRSSNVRRPVDLEQLAGARFDQLTDAEIKLLRAAPEGETAYCGPSKQDDDPNNNPASADNWGSERCIRAELIRWLCVDRGGKERVDPRGIRAHAACIRGKLDLSFVVIPFFLGLLRCRLSDDLDLRFIDVPSMDFSGTCLASLNADHATVKGSISLQGLWSKGAVKLRHVRIGGHLACDGGTFRNPAQVDVAGSGTALSADGAKVTGAVLLRNGFTAEGTVRLFGAEIGGYLECEGGKFRSPAKAGIDRSGIALEAPNAKVTGAVLLGNGFAAEGQVRFYGAQIGGNLDCDGGKFQNPAKAGIVGSGIALEAANAKVTGDVLLGNGFAAEGMVRLFGAAIGGTFQCNGGKFQNPAKAGIVGSGIALEAANAKVTGAVFLRNGFTAEGQVRLHGAEIGRTLDCNGGKFQNPAKAGIVESGIALDASNAEVTGSVLLGNGFAAEGQVGLYGAEIEGTLDCNGGRFQNPAAANVAESGMALSAVGAKVAGSVLLRNGFAAEGQVGLFGAEIEGNLECDGGKFQNPAKAGIAGSGIALDAPNAKVTGDVLLRSGFTAEGQVRLYGAEIEGTLDCNRGKFQNPANAGIVGSGIALDAPNAKVTGDVLLHSGFTAAGEVRLHGAEIGGTLACDAGKFQNPAVANVTASGMALNAEGAKVARAVYLRNGFAAEGMVRLTHSEIGGNLECDRGRFQNPAVAIIFGCGTALDAQGAKVAGDVYLRNRFAAEGMVRLYGAQIGGNLECQSGTFDTLDLRNASATAIVDDKNSWPKPGNLFLDGFAYGRISGGPVTATERLGWLARQASFTRQPYRQLAKVLKEEGDDRGWRRVSAEMERKTWEGRRWIFRPLSCLLRGTVGYGYFSMRALWWLLALVIVGLVVYGRGYEAGSIVPTQKDAYDSFATNKRLPGYYEAFHALRYSLENSFPLIKLGVQDKWAPGPEKQGPPGQPCSWQSHLLSRITSPGFLRGFRLFQICAGWILATLFVGGVTGVIRKD